MNKPTVSVVVSVYNTGKYIAKCMESLLKQTYSDFEIIIVDDGSTDDSAYICDNYSNQSNIRIIHKENGGLSSARNVGIDVAQGNYIVFPDPDDWVEVNYLQLLIERVNEYPDAIICSGYFVSYDDYEKPYKDSPQLYLYQKQEALEKLMIGGGYNGFAWNKLLDLQVIRDNNLRFDTELGMAQDLHFMVQYFQLFDQVVFDTTETYHYYQQSGGVTTSGLSTRKISGLKTYEKIAEMTAETYPVISQMALCTLVNLSMNMIEKYYSGKRDKQVLYSLELNIKKYKNVFLRSRNHSFFRKLEMLMASLSPYIYYVARRLFNRV